MVRNVIFILLVFFIAACSGVTTRHGYIPSDEELEALQIGQTTTEDVLNEIGNPSVVNEEYGTTWIYMESKQFTRGMAKPQTTERNVVVLTFEDDGALTNVETLGLENGRTVKFTQRVTKTYAGRLTVIQQILRSFGNFGSGALIAPAERQFEN